MNFLRKALAFAFILPLYVLLPAGNLRGAQTTVWQIGIFNQSPHEFNEQAPVGNPSYNPVYIVGKSTNKDWPSRQPGSQNNTEGSRPHPFTILFDLGSKPHGTYRLTISELLYDPRVPKLEISINGQKGGYYLPRKLSYYPGVRELWVPIYSGGEINIDLPSGALHKGRNKLVLTAVDQPNSGPADSWITYDALRLSHAPQKVSFKPQISVNPTILYAQKAGNLEEAVQVTARLGRKVRRGTVRLTLAGHHYDAKLSPEPDFGDQRFEFMVPALSAPAPAELTLHANGKTVKKKVTFRPAKQWTIYVVPHMHLDVGFTDYRGKVFESHDRNTDTLIKYLPKHPSMRWSLDGSLIAQHYLATRKPAARQAFLKLAREDRIVVPAQYANLLTGYASLEGLIRSTFYSYHLHQKYGIAFDYANITDVPSYTWSYPSILNALGIRYLAAAANSYRAPILLWGKWNTKSPFWWEGPDGSKVLMSYARQYQQLTFTCQLPAQVEACRESLPTFLQTYDSPSYKPDVALMFGTQVENRQFVPGDSEFIEKWNAMYTYPKFVIATFPQYFRYIDKHYGKELPTVRGDGGPYWEDGIGSDARYVAIDRSNQQRALSAEKLSTLGTYVQKDAAGEQHLIRRMWQNLDLFAEHTFTSWGGFTRPHSNQTARQMFTKNQFAVNSRQEIRSILDQSLSQLADQIHMPPLTIVVFNPLSWQRSGFVEADINDNMQLEEYPDMNVVPYQVLRRGNGYNHVRFLARKVPSMGYKCYKIVPAAAGANPAAQEASLPISNSIENAYYRVVFDPASGAIKSIYDKQLGKELVNPSSPYRANQYIYVAGGHNTRIMRLNFGRAVPKLAIHPSSGGRVTGIRRTSYGTIMTYETSGMNAPRIKTDVILFNHQKKIEFVDHLDKKPEMHNEAVYFAFPFAIDHPDFSYEIQNGWVDPARNILKGGSLEWFTVQHWVRVGGSQFSVGLVPVDAPLVCLGDINRGSWPKRFQPKDATVYSYPINNYWDANYGRVQKGRYTFRYVLTSGENLSRTPWRISDVTR